MVEGVVELTELEADAEEGDEGTDDEFPVFEATGEGRKGLAALGGGGEFEAEGDEAGEHAEEGDELHGEESG